MSASADHPRPRPSLFASSLRIARDPLVLLILAILVLGSLTSEYYLTMRNLETLLRFMAVIGLLSLGVTIVMLTGRIDLSVAAIMVFAVISAVVFTKLLGGWMGERWVVRGNSFVGPASLVFLATLVAGCVLGLINGIGVAYFKVSSFIMTLVTLTALRGGNYILTDGHPYYLQSDAFRWVGNASVLGIPFSFLVFCTVLAFLAWLMGSTNFGRHVYAIGGNEKAAIYAGLKTNRIVILTFMISGLCSAVAGILFTSRLASVDAPLASGYELTAIAIAVIGGTALSGGVGSPWRTLLAAVAFAAGLNLLSIWGVSTWYQNLAIGLTLLIAVGLSPASRKRLQL